MEHDPTDEEQSEAEALARALERGTGSPELPEDALMTAALLRYGADGGELAPEREKAILDELMSTARVPEPQRARSPLRWLAWAAPAFGVAAAALLFVFFGATTEPAPEAVSLTATPLPQPSAELLSAQAAATRNDEGSAEQLSSEMRAHRRQLFAALSAHYQRASASRVHPSLAPMAFAIVGPPLILLGASGCAATTAPSGVAGRWVTSVEDAHVRAATAIDAGDYDTARAVLEDALVAAAPGRIPPEDLRVVHQDLRYALAEVALAVGEPETARMHADEGLSLGREQDLYTANLLVARGRALVDEGSDVEAASDYYEALEINDALLRRILGQ